MQSEPVVHARKKTKAIRQPYEPKLSIEDYELIAKSVRETIEESMTMIVTSQQAMQMVLDSKMAELKTFLERVHQA